MKIKSKIILPHVYLLTYPTQYELCMSFVRMQEFYESASPKFRGKYFTLEDYIDYWSLEHGSGSFTYPSVWNGFNFSSDVLRQWVSKFKQDMRPREDVLLGKVANLAAKEFKKGSLEWNKDPYYLIGVNEEGDKEEMNHALEHETAHALYYLYPEYKKSCDILVEKIPQESYDNSRQILLDMGYCKGVINDELQAYHSTAQTMFDPCPEFAVNYEIFKKKLMSKNNSK